MNASLRQAVPLLPGAEQWLAGARLPETVAVGWSGGIDSTALLLALQASGHRVRAWHVDHGWHEDSAHHAAVLRQKAEEWGIPFYSARVRTPPIVNREATSRQSRYRQFSEWRLEQGVDALCLAHHLDDQAETVCMRMLQGGGVLGCRGMRDARRMDSGLQVFRPLLHTSKSMLMAALQQAGVEWLEDDSNRDTSLLRNHIRHRFFPAVRQAGVDPVELWSRWQRQAERITGLLERGAAGLPIENRFGSVTVAWERWVDQPAAIRAYVLQRMTKVLFGSGASLGRRHIMLVERWREEGGHGGIDLSRSRLSHRDGHLRLDATKANLDRLRT
ncbi:MAG TPA: tRNA lysidine(34) synthetase TilS [Mariprofundaceae bacterium]|nr:tRNA lysidine(34) synthetase TilS [Mariprofundaceae bacterium]